MRTAINAAHAGSLRGFYQVAINGDPTGSLPPQMAPLRDRCRVFVGCALMRTAINAAPAGSLRGFYQVAINGDPTGSLPP